MYGSIPKFRKGNASKLEQSIETVSYKDAVFHEATESWIQPQKDPYTLENFQRAYENLSSGNSVQTLTRSVTEEFTGLQQLEATHYALKIYPKNEKEQWKVELMEDVKVAYLPFDYVQLSEDIVKNSTELTISEATLYPDESRYTVTYDDLETIEGPVEPETYVMPVLYVVWPIDKPLPHDLDYEVDYEVFLPQSVTQMRSASLLSEHAMQVLENEAIQLTLGSLMQTKATTRSTSQTYTGIVTGYDYFAMDNMGIFIPIPNLKLRFQLGSSIWDIYTQSDGNFSTISDIPDAASFGYILQHARWKITSESSTAPISKTLLYQVGATWPMYNGNIDLRASYPCFTSHCAANFYYHGLHELTRYYYSDGIRIRASSNANSANGMFTFSKSSPAYITIYNNNAQNTNYQIGTVLHELGHLTHFGTRGGYDNYRTVHDLIAESYGSYAGWYLGERYYFFLGYAKPFPALDPTGQGRQLWTMGSTSHYSPLFVDLIDDYDQSIAGTQYIFDAVSNVPHSVIARIAREATNWTTCRSILEGYTGVYYTEYHINSILGIYNFWFANNN